MKYNFIINLSNGGFGGLRRTKRIKVRADSFNNAVEKAKKRYPDYPGVGICLFDTKYVEKYGFV